ncbi:MAG: FAD-dependent oxidoreductase [Spirochaetaceae bacterium]|nr:MAG: FAD-dependent oxidoreductase [Spirochaetaceae bacterium]
MPRDEIYLEPEKELEVYGHYDVVIVGGGCAGITASIAAARNGAKTLIIERFPFFGGTATASLMGNINGFRNQVEPDSLQTTKGIGEEIILRLIEIGGVGKPPAVYSSKIYPNTKGKLSYCFAVDIEKFKYITLLTVRNAGVDILFHTYFAEVIADDNALKGIIIENKSGRQAIFAKVIIDASGDGDVAFRAGVPFWQTKGNERHRLTDCLMYKVVGVPENHQIKGCESNGSVILWGPDAGPIDATNAHELTEGEIHTRLRVYENLKEQQENNSDLKEARVVETGPLLGIRQTRFIKGLYTLSGDDVIQGRRFDDSVAMASSPVIHYYGYRRFLEHEGYEIPYRCMLPQGVDNLIVSGRCISSDQIAYESWRAMAHVMAIGEAAGTAAALSVKQHAEPKDLNIQTLQKQLVEQGAEIGQGRKQRN